MFNGWRRGGQADRRARLRDVQVKAWKDRRRLSVSNIAGQLGCSEQALTRSIARFKAMAGLDSAGGVRFIRPGAGSNGDKSIPIKA
jgi:hypothetical protein